MMSSPLASTVRGGKASLAQLPSVDRVLKLAGVLVLAERHGRTFVTREVRELLLAWRNKAAHGVLPPEADEFTIVSALSTRIATRRASAVKPVFNLTGTVLHTNLGRALLADDAIAAVVRAMRAPVNLEFNLESGERGDRDALVEELLCELTGAEAVTIVNNNAAAVLLTIAALAAKREVIVSRGELVEIGGSFRMPDVMRSAGARMVEVGTTNRTHPADYAGAITARTGLILKVHASNYAVTGFTAAVAEADLARIAREHRVPFAVDLGSGSLADLAAYGLPREPTPRESLAAGADIVTFSGDKLLGGPQAGLIVGKAEWIRKIKRHPLKRALRVSKLTLAALEATLALYRHPEQLTARLPTLRLLTRPLPEIEALAARMAPLLSIAVGDAFAVTQGAVSSQIGSGSLPVDVLPSAGLFVRNRREGRGGGRKLIALAGALRALPVPVIGRMADDALVLDLRTLTEDAVFGEQLVHLKLRAVAP
jgi:L-seryl-tRNA(Ser) seleniumtransferase